MVNLTIKRILLIVIFGVLFNTGYGFASNNDQFQKWKTAYIENCKKIEANLTASKSVFEQLDKGALDQSTALQKMQQLDQDLVILQTELNNLPAIDTISITAQDQLKI